MSKLTNWFAEVWESIFPESYNLEELRKTAANYASSKNSPPKKPDGSTAQHAMRESGGGYDIKEKQEVYYQVMDLEDDPIPDMLRSSLTPGEAKALGVILDGRKEKTFRDKLLDLIDKRGYRDSYVYRRAHIDRRLFSKIAGDRFYKPAKDTVLAFAIALKCSLREANELLESAGYLLSQSSRRDMLIEYFFTQKIYDLDVANTLLMQLGEKIIGRENVG